MQRYTHLFGDKAGANSILIQKKEKILCKTSNYRKIESHLNY
jgi:hypothetical protein